MKIIEPKVEEIKDFEGVDNFYKAVARAARICYASDKTTDDKALVERLIKSKHFSPFEHAIIYQQDNQLYFGKKYLEDDYLSYIVCCINEDKKYIVRHGYTNRIVAINGRFLIEKIIEYKESRKLDTDIFILLEEILKCFADYDKPYPSYKDEYFFKSFIVDTSIGCTREMNRHHNDFYICEQSTRFCDFSKDKFGNEVAFNKPYWYDTKSDVYKHWWEDAMKNAEMLYMTAIKNIPDDLKNCSDNEFGMGFLTDEARGILPLDTHTRAIYTATIEEWQHIIDLRLKGTTGKPHGDIKIITEKINNLINGI